MTLMSNQVNSLGDVPAAEPVVNNVWVRIDFSQKCFRILM